MIHAGTNMTTRQPRKWLGTDDVAQKTHFGRKQPSEQLGNNFKTLKDEGADSWETSLKNAALCSAER